MKEAIQKATSKYLMFLESCYPSRLLPNRETSLLEELSIIPLEKAWQKQMAEYVGCPKTN